MGAEFEGGFRVRCDNDTKGVGYETTSVGQQCSYYLGGYEIDNDVVSILTCILFGESDGACSWVFE